MTKEYTDQIFRTTYRDDFAEEDNYHRVLFNSGKALQARELTQMQTIIQKEISRMGDNLFVEGASMTNNGVKVDELVRFIKLEVPSGVEDLTTLIGTVLVGTTTGYTVRVQHVTAATETDKETLYVTYITGSSSTNQAGETMTVVGGVLDGTTVQVQILNPTANPAVGKSSFFYISEGSFYVQGHFVFCPAQFVILSKYTTGVSATVGFKVIQDIVTADDTDALYDNQGVTPNLASPGADRYRIRLQLSNKDDIVATDTFVFLTKVTGGLVEKNVISQASGINSVRKEMAKRTFEESGNYIKKNFLAHFEPNSATTFKLRISPGVAYVNGYRVEKTVEQILVVDKPTETVSKENDVVSSDFGSYYEYLADSGTSNGMFDINSLEEVYLKDSADVTFGTANVRAVHKGTSQNNLYLFNVTKTSTDQNFNIRKVQTVSTKEGAEDNSASYVTLDLNADGLSTLISPNKQSLLFPTSAVRPQSFSDIQLTVSRLITATSTAGGAVTIQNLPAGESFTLFDQWIISTVGANGTNDYAANLGTTSASSVTFTQLPPNASITVLAYVTKTAEIRVKRPLTDTITTTVSIDPVSGKRIVPLGQSDITRIVSVNKDSAGGDDLREFFLTDNGQRDTHYDDGKLVYRGFGLDSASQPVHVSFNYLEHGQGDVFTVDSYTGEVAYDKIPSYKLSTGGIVNLRNVFDFRPSTNGTGVFGAVHINELPRPTSSITADAEYYLGRKDALLLSSTGEFFYKKGTSDFNPSFPNTDDANTLELYKFALNPNTLNTADLTSKINILRSYSMRDIGRIDKKLDALEETVTLSLLEQYTVQEKLYGDDGIERIKSGFFVDNFKNHNYSYTKAVDYRAAIDPQNLYVRPSFIHREPIALYYDTADVLSTNTVKVGNKVLLSYDEVPYVTQNIASRTVNINPFPVSVSGGAIKLSPSGDNWFNTELDAPLIQDGGTQLDTTNALLWNSWEWNWSGVDINNLQIGDTQSHSSTVGGEVRVVHAPAGGSTPIATSPIQVGGGPVDNTGNPDLFTVYGDIGLSVGNFPNLDGIDFSALSNIRVVGTNGAFIAGMPSFDILPSASTIDGTGINTTINIDRGTFGSLRTEDVLPGQTVTLVLAPDADWTGSSNRAQRWASIGSQTGDDVVRGCTVTNISGDGKELTLLIHVGVTGWSAAAKVDFLQYEDGRGRGVTWQTQNRYNIEGVVGIVFEENEDEIDENNDQPADPTPVGDAPGTYTSASTTTVTVNRVAGESTLRTLIGTKVLDIATIPWLRSRTISFRAMGLLANTQYYAFFNNTSVANFVRSKPFVESSDRDIDYDYSNATAVEHSEGATILRTGASGIIEGEFELPCNTAYKFRSGAVSFELLDIDTYNLNNATSSAKAVYNVVGTVDREEYSQVRVLEIVGSQTQYDTPASYNPQLSSDNVVIHSSGEEQNITPVNNATGSAATISSDQDTVYVNLEDNLGDTQEVTAVAVSNPTTYDPNELYVVDATDYPNEQTSIPAPIDDASNVLQKYDVVPFKYIDPTAQSFSVEDPNGIFLTRVDLYFATKPSTNDTVSVEIRPMEFGTPSGSHMINNSKVYLHPNQVTAGVHANINDMKANATTFVFNEPLFLDGGREYAIIIKSDSQDYTVYLSKIADFVLGTTDEKITKQPAQGSYFKSQNSYTWTPDQSQDIAFVLHRANFASQGNAIFNNRTVEATELDYNPLHTTIGSNVVRVFLKGHGFRSGDTCSLYLPDDGPISYNGILPADIIGARQVIASDALTYTFAAGTSANRTGRCGNGRIRSTQNIIFETIKPILEMETPSATNHTLFAKFISTTSLAAGSSHPARFVEDAAYRVVKNQENYSDFDYPMMIANPTDEYTQFGDDKTSSTWKMSMSTTDPRVSPAIDMEKANIIAVSNLIDNQYMSSLASKNNPITFVPETAPSGGSSAAKHITIPVKLTEESDGIKILLNANRPPESEIHVYYRTASVGTVIESQQWTIINREDEVASDKDKAVFRQYRYIARKIIGSNDISDVIPVFTEFQVKIVFTSTNSTKCPVIRDLRCIASAS